MASDPDRHQPDADMLVEAPTDDEATPHTGHFSRIGGTWWCDTCNSPYCDLA